MPVKENKALVRRYYSNIASEANLEVAFNVADQILAPNFAFYPLDNTQGSHRLDSHKQFLAGHQGVIADQHWAIEELSAAGDTVVSRFTVRGTHQGELLGVAPTGKACTVSGMDFFHITGARLPNSCGSLRPRTDWNSLALSLYQSKSQASNILSIFMLRRDRSANERALC